MRFPFPDSPAPHGLTVAGTIRTYRPYVLRKLQQWRVPEAQIPDVCQEIFIAVAERLPTFAPDPRISLDDAMKGWLSIISARKAWACFAALRRRGPELLVTADELEALADAAAILDDTCEGREQWAILCALIDQLEPDRRAVFVAYYLEDRSMKAIATELGIAPNTAWNRLRLAREDLQAAARRLSARKSNGVLVLLALLFRDERRDVLQDSESAIPQPEPGSRGAQWAVTVVGSLLLGVVLCWHRPPVLPPGHGPVQALSIDLAMALAATPRADISPTESPTAPVRIAVHPAAPSLSSPALLHASPSIAVRDTPAPRSPSLATPTPWPRRGDHAYFKEARDVVRAGRPDVIRWALETHASAFAVRSLAAEREALSAGAPSCPEPPPK